MALIVMSRYLNSTDPAFADYIVQSYRHAEAAGIATNDLKFLRVVAEAIGRPI